ncbi:MAG TPA: sigma-70 family RNA polymerase sigma factor [Bacteroidales bacterium]|nr:sigma-70 family RNA polymerase sigma factor [Bacteroidales bacterium]
MGLSDEALLLSFKNAENPSKAFEQIVKKYQRQVYWLVRRMVICHDDANDIAQEVFIKAWKALPDFRGDSGLFTWLYRIASNEALSYLKKKKNREFLAMPDAENILATNTASEFFLSETEIEIKIQKAIDHLPEKQRLVFILRYYQEMKYEEMAVVLDTSVGALKTSYHHAAKKIEKFITS